MFGAQRTSRLAIGSSGVPARAEVYEIPKGLVQTDRISEDLPFGSRGGIAIHHHFPLDGEYVIQVRLQRANDGNLIQGLTEERQIDVRIDGERIKLFKVGGSNAQSDRSADAELEVRFPMKAGSRVVGVTFIKDTLVPEAGRQQISSIGNITINGPYKATGAGDTPSRNRVFICHPG